MVKWMWKKILRDLLDALKEVVDEWLAKEGNPLPKDRSTQRAVEPKVGTLTKGSSAVEVGQSGMVDAADIKITAVGGDPNEIRLTRDKANEILKGRR